MCSCASPGMLRQAQTSSDRLRAHGGVHFRWKSVVKKERKVISVKCSGTLFVTVVVIALSGSVGFGAILDADCAIKPSDSYDVFLTDTVDVGEPFPGTALDILTPNQDVTGDRGHIAITVTEPPINTIGDGIVYPDDAMTNVQISLNHDRIDRMVDLAEFQPIVLNPAEIKYAVDTRLEIALKATKFGNLAPASPFDFKVDFWDGGTNADDRL